MAADRRGHDGPEPRAGERRQPGGVFISYRRGYTSGQAHAIRERLARRYGARRVFMDVDAIVPGTDFVQRIEEAVDSSAVMLVLIGRDWLGDPGGRRGLDNPDDFVRMEVSAALDRKVPTMPVLIEDTQLPAPAELPESLRPLLRMQAVTLANASWDHDLSRVVRAVASLIEHRRRWWRRSATWFADMIRRHLQSGRRQLVAALVGTAAIALAVLAVIIFPGHAPPATAHNHALPAPPPGEVFKDRTGVISVTVPTTWGDQESAGWNPIITGVKAGTSIGPGLNASTNVRAWFNDLKIPGIFVGASKTLVGLHYDPKTLLGATPPWGTTCNYASQRAYAVGGLTGYRDTWTCPNSATHFETVALWPADHAFLAYVEIKIVAPVDEASGNRALASLSVRRF